MDKRSNYESKIAFWIWKTFQLFFGQTWQSLAKEIWNEECTKFFVLIKEPPSAATQSCIASMHKVGLHEIDIEKEGIEEFSFICWRILRPGRYAIIFTSFTWCATGFWLSTRPNFVVIPYLFAVLFTPSFITGRHVSEFPNNCAQYVVIARAPANYQQNFNPHFWWTGTNSKSLTSDDCAMIRDVLWPKLKSTRPGSKKPLEKSKTIVRLLTNLGHLSTPPEGFDMQSFCQDPDTCNCSFSKVKMLYINGRRPDLLQYC